MSMFGITIPLFWTLRAARISKPQEKFNPPAPRLQANFAEFKNPPDIYWAEMQSILENFRSALHSLSSSWLRTVLTTLGILIGVGSVGLLIAIALGVQKQITEEVQDLGTNLVFIVPGKLDKN